MDLGWFPAAFNSSAEFPFDGERRNALRALALQVLTVFARTLQFANCGTNGTRTRALALRTDVTSPSR
jgi:hypothetical protein